MYGKLKSKIMTLALKAWEGKIDWPEVEAWLENFDGSFIPKDEEEIIALFILSQTLYFGQGLMREMLKCIYTQLYRYPIIVDTRKKHSDSLDIHFILNEFETEKNRTRFLGVGNPSESGPHLLYYFRQVNDLPKDLFMDSAAIIKYTPDGNGNLQASLRDPNIKRYVFIDDLLGSGTQIERYLKEILAQIRKCSTQVEVYYYCLFATSEGAKAARSIALFGEHFNCIYELDNSFKCFDLGSRHFAKADPRLDATKARAMALGYGERIFGAGSRDALGYKNGQLLLALHHNTPDNTLPIIWHEDTSWTPIFKRFHKVY